MGVLSATPSFPTFRLSHSVPPFIGKCSQNALFSMKKQLKEVVWSPVNYRLIPQAAKHSIKPQLDDCLDVINLGFCQMRYDMHIRGLFDSYHQTLEIEKSTVAL